MKFLFSLILICCLYLSGVSQGFELLDRHDSYEVALSETIRIPLRIKNQTEKAQFYIIRKVSDDLGASQKGYFCLDKKCLESGIDEFSKRVEPGETLQNFVYVLESGMQSTQNTIKFQFFARGNSTDVIDHAVHIMVEEKMGRPVLFHSREITIQDVYPNPVQEYAFMDYRIHQESVDAKVVIQNILGKPITELDLLPSETRVKFQTEDFSSGIYFYTIYLDNNAVLTRKLIIRK